MRGLLLVSLVTRRNRAAFVTHPHQNSRPAATGAQRAQHRHALQPLHNVAELLAIRGRNVALVAPVQGALDATGQPGNGELTEARQLGVSVVGDQGDQLVAGATSHLVGADDASAQRRCGRWTGAGWQGGDVEGVLTGVGGVGRRWGAQPSDGALKGAGHGSESGWRGGGGGGGGWGGCCSGGGGVAVFEGLAAETDWIWGLLKCNSQYLM